MNQDLNQRALHLLQTVFGYPAFRGQQADIVDHVSHGGDALERTDTLYAQQEDLRAVLARLEGYRSLDCLRDFVVSALPVACLRSAIGSNRSCLAALWPCLQAY